MEWSCVRIKAIWLLITLSCLSVFSMKSSLWTTHAGSWSTILMGAERFVGGAGCCVPAWLLQPSASKHVVVCKKRCRSRLFRLV